MGERGERDAQSIYDGEQRGAASRAPDYIEGEGEGEGEERGRWKGRERRPQYWVTKDKRETRRDSKTAGIEKGRG
jgi:hypothetical protein